MSKYKREVLGVEEDGIWLRNGRPYTHILPQKSRQLNILPRFREEFWAWFAEQSPRIQLHSDFHHLNSSQALCFNLFFPMLRNNGQALGTLCSALKIEEKPDKQACFEFQPDLREGSCIDFSMPLQSGARINFEIKYTESEFGAAKADKAHLEKFETIYECRLAGRFEKSFCCEAKFLKHYQIARNIWHLNDATGDIAVFLFPKANTCLRRRESVITACALEPFRSRIRIVYLEDLISGLHGRLPPSETAGRKYLDEFRLKYFPALSFVSRESAS